MFPFLDWACRAQSFHQNERLLSPRQESTYSVDCPSQHLGAPDPSRHFDTSMFAVKTGWGLMNCTGSAAGIKGRDRANPTNGWLRSAGKDKCNGYFVSTTCNITEAVGEYHVKISRQTITLNNHSPKLNVVTLANDQAPERSGNQRLRASTWHVRTCSFECNLAI